MTPQAAYIIGIDLGTTNSVVAYTDADGPADHQRVIRRFDIPQLVEPGAVQREAVLPSFVLLGQGRESAGNALALPWDPAPDMAVGRYARDRGAEVPRRLIASTKSWLCCDLVDRTGPILPWNGTDEDESVPKRSPVEASAEILGHIRRSWNHTMASQRDEWRMEHQEIFLTVPASFNAVARELTVQAAAAAGLTRLTLLEEPLAAFYAWIHSAGRQWHRQVAPGQLIVVCDIGGGTTDLTLIRVGERDGRLDLERIAVGDHLLVGGDNQDMALAYHVAARLAREGNRLDNWQMRALFQACRQAKEKLLAPDGPESVPVTVLGRGSGLIGGTLQTNIARAEAETLILDGFLPDCGISERPQQRAAVGIREIGLAYESDPAISKHLAAFLERRSPQSDQSAQLPAKILFNGGVMKSERLRHRILRLVGAWKAAAGQDGLDELAAAETDQAVASGAVVYGLASRGEGIRVRSGLNRSYYVGIEAAMPAVPGVPTPVKALCVAPFGAEEGTTVRLDQRPFVLTVGQPVRFDFLSSAQRRSDPAGAVVEDWEGDIEPLTTLEAHLDGEAGSAVPVTLEVGITPTGTLDIWCAAVDGRQRWKLSFSVREKEA